MKYVIILIISIFITNCSLNKDSHYWTEDVIKKQDNQKKLSKILKSYKSPSGIKLIVDVDPISFN